MGSSCIPNSSPPPSPALPHCRLPQKLRNALFATYGPKPKRALKRNGVTITWAAIKAIAGQDRDASVAAAHRLTTKGHVEPDSHEKMRVHLAVDVFHPSTTLAIQQLLQAEDRPEGTDGCVEYLQAGWRLWCAMYAGSDMEAATHKKDKLTAENFGAFRTRLEGAVKWFADWAKSCTKVRRVLKLGGKQRNASSARLQLCLVNTLAAAPEIRQAVAWCCSSCQ